MMHGRDWKDFEKRGLGNKLFLRRRFFTTMMEEGDDILEHINKLKTIAEQLEAVGAPVSKNDLVITLLESLSETYQFLITALESRADTLTWEVVTSRLLHEDIKRKEQGGDGAAPEQAFMMKDAKRKGRPAKKTGACHNCGKQGHWIAECPSRVQNDTDRYRLQRANITQFEDSNNYLFSIGGSSDSVKANDVWLVDSGATQHMTSSNKFMRNYKAFSPVRTSGKRRRRTSYQQRRHRHVNEDFTRSEEGCVDKSAAHPQVVKKFILSWTLH
ncbi:gag-pol polyprotein [Plasmopara halstedii]|uniref:Gag-pol polyprotein n=1 Tax=Plasmopara halstedii TaxID=4781 RepID=A0A0P1AKJ3_PLAHL|nr:gag-pol polyprotein [Plasmopara halstedii]CEG41910.1 gag-pol polyprotein [Plasmopara halstedii]|eukprot:XP_024578279.1 gag-pol polyprotein [Plasmopara halstedii]